MTAKSPDRKAASSGGKAVPQRLSGKRHNKRPPPLGRPPMAPVFARHRDKIALPRVPPQFCRTRQYGAVEDTEKGFVYILFLRSGNHPGILPKIDPEEIKCA